MPPKKKTKKEEPSTPVEEDIREEVGAEEEVEDAELPPIDPDHPWAEASRFSSPSPQEVMARFDIAETQVEVPGKGVFELQLAMLTCITAGGVHNYFFNKALLGRLINQATKTYHDIKPIPTQGGLVVATPEQAKQEAATYSKIQDTFKGKGNG